MNVSLQPFSPAAVTKALTKVFTPLNNAQHVTLASYSGSGKKTLVKYIIDQHIPQLQPTLFININATRLVENYADAMKAAMIFGYSKKDSQLPESVNKLLEILSTDFTNYYFFELIEQIKKTNIRLIILFEDWESMILHSNYSAFETLEVFLNKGLNNISVLYICYANIFSDEIQIKERYRRSLFNNVVFDKDIQFTDEDYQYALDWQQHLSGQVPQIDHSLKSIIISAARKDLSLLKHIFIKTISDKEFLHQIQTATTIESLYLAIGNDFLDHKYSQWLAMLSYKELVELRTTEINLISDSNYLRRVGLLENPIPILFEHFIKNRSANLKSKSQFTPTEQLVFDMLNKSLNQVVSRDRIADAIWGTNWIKKYSEYMIDKVLSNIRKKTNTEYEVSALKGQGFVLKRIV